MPLTKAIFGRVSKPKSHFLYYSTLSAKLGKAALQLKDPTPKRMLLEVRVGGEKGAQTVFPGSVHESGEPIEWAEDGEPTQLDDDEAVRLAKLIAGLCLFARYWPPEGSRHDAALTVGGFLARCGFDPACAKSYIELVARAAKDEQISDRGKAAEDAAIAYARGEKTRGFPALKELFGDRVADKVAEWLGHPGTRNANAGLGPQAKRSDANRDWGEKPTIRVRAHEGPAIAKRAEEVLLSSRAPIYQRAGKLVRPITEEADASHGRRTKVARLVEISPIYLRNELDKVAVWEKFDRRVKKVVLIGAPMNIAHVILSQVGHGTFNPIAGVITTPTMRPDGSLLLNPEYDEATRLLLIEPPPMPLIPERATKDDAVRALRILNDLLEEFPFVDEVPWPGRWR